MHNENLTVRMAKNGDIPRIGELLAEICTIHAESRPDLFVVGGRKYSDVELSEIIKDPARPIFVADGGGKILGYAFCVIKNTFGSSAMREHKTLYIDDICIDSGERGKGIGRMLFEFCRETAKKLGCYNLTLNVWSFNRPAIDFYEKMGMNVQSMHMETIINDK